MNTVAASPMSPQTDIHSSRVLILDFGAQYTQLIARRVREQGVYCEILPWDVTNDDVRKWKPKGHHPLGRPGVGHRQGTAARAAGGVRARRAGARHLLRHADHGAAARRPVRAQQSSRVRLRRSHRASHLTNCFDGLFDRQDAQGRAVLDVWMSHGDSVDTLPAGFHRRRRAAPTRRSPPWSTNRASSTPCSSIPEVTHTLQGKQLLERFVREICGCEPLWSVGNIIEDAIARVRAQVGKGKVLLGLSGGVDSSVVAALLHKAIGDQLVCVFVDHGLMRLNEGDQVMKIFADNLGVKVIRVDAEARFLDALRGETDPEKKRKIIGGLFVKVFDEEATKLTGVDWLAQGTIYPDVIESAGSKTGKAHVIKSHHNVGGLPANMRMKLVEPLRELFKDEVRRLGVELGLPREMVYRHPFPGPGLGVRILGEVRKDYADLLRQADAIFIEELRRHDLYDKTSQAFAVFLPVRSVGVMGDGRRYDYVVALRAVETVDFMTAHWARLPYDFLDICSRRIVNEVKGISRVVYDISGKPPATIEWE